MSLALLKNAAWGVLGEFAVRGAKIAQVILIARFLGAEDIGRLNYAIATVGLFSVLFDFGIVPVAVKALAANPESPALRLYARLKLLTSSIGLALLGVAVLLLSITPTEAWITFGMGVYLALSDLGTFITVVYRTKGEFWRETVWRSITALLQFVGCIGALLLTHNIAAVVIALIGTALVGIVPLFFEWRQQPVMTQVTNGWLGIYSAFRKCLPLAGIVLVNSVYMNLDIVVMGKYTSMTEVGWYSVVVKSVFSLMIMPLHYLQLALLPVYAAGMGSSRLGSINAKWLQGFVLSVSTGAVLCVSTAMLAGPLLVLLFGANFAAAAPVLIVFSLIGLMFYIYTPLSQWLLLHDKQKISLHVYIIGMFVNCFTVFLFIPLWGLWGAVVAALATHISIAVGHLIAVYKGGGFKDCPTFFASIFRLTFGVIIAIAMLYYEVGGGGASKILAMATFILISHREIIDLCDYIRINIFKFTSK